MKVPQVHDLFERFANLKNVLYNNNAIIHYNIELVTSRSCTSVYHFCSLKISWRKFQYINGWKIESHMYTNTCHYWIGKVSKHQIVHCQTQLTIFKFTQTKV